MGIEIGPRNETGPRKQALLEAIRGTQSPPRKQGYELTQLASDEDMEDEQKPQHVRSSHTCTCGRLYGVACYAGPWYPQFRADECIWKVLRHVQLQHSGSPNIWVG